MLICDRCKFKCCHIYCCDPPLDKIPLEDWFCKFCLPRNRQTRQKSQNESSTGLRRREDEDSIGSMKESQASDNSRGYRTRSCVNPQRTINPKKRENKRYPLRNLKKSITTRTDL